jgi:uncharacterized membrane protein YcaP (DUF421 family)
MELTKDLFLVAGRIITILPLLLFLTLYMGKRSIGELPVFDFLAILTLGAVVGADIADPKIEHIHTIFAMILIAFLQKTLAKSKISHRKIEKTVTFEPTVVMENGMFLSDNLKKIQYSIDNILGLLREKDVFDIRDVQLAIIEGNGKLSIIKKPEKTNVKVEDLHIAKQGIETAFPVIVEGIIYREVLDVLHVDEAWLMKQLESQQISSLNEIFFASINKQKELHICKRHLSLSHHPHFFH